MERWVLGRQGWVPDADPMELRKYYIRRTYREAAPDMEKFYFGLQKSYYEDPIAVEFEENEYRMAQWATWNPSKKDRSKTLAEELTGYLDDASKNVKNPLAKEHVSAIRAEWLSMLDAAKKVREGGN